jgi:hypothetical protein
MPEPPPPESQPEASETTASGLREQELNQADIEQLRAQFRFSALPSSIDCSVQTLTDWPLAPGLEAGLLQRVPLDIPPVRSRPLKLAPLPGRVKVQHLRPDPVRLRVQRDLPRALGQPIRRTRVLPGDLAVAEQAAVNRAFVAKYGSGAARLHLQAVFREVPPEAAKSVRLDEALRFCQFELPAGVPVHKLHSGHALAVAIGDSGKTYPLLVRL